MFERLMFFCLVVVCVFFAAACENVEPTVSSRQATTTATDIFLSPDTRTIERFVPRRSTLAGLLEDHSFDRAEAHTFINAVRDVFDPRRLRGGNSYRVVHGDDGSFRRFEYHIDEDQFLRVSEVRGNFVASLIPYIKSLDQAVLRGTISEEHSSLVSAINDGGERVMLAIRMTEVFSGEIDFNNDLRRGDRFEVLFEKYFREDEFSGYGNVIAVEFQNDGRIIRAFRFHVPGEAEAQYFDTEGRSLRRLFLRSPFKFEPRITSGFSYRRLHPILGGHRPHLGVDYGAPTGTPVIAVANGMVVSAGRSGGSGNMVRLRHTNGYETYYLHLSAFGSGIRKGVRVSQGQVIGRVGATGLATGPHLDYRMRKQGEFVNPLLEHRKLPPGDPVPDQHLSAFHEVRAGVVARLESELSSSLFSVDHEQ